MHARKSLFQKIMAEWVRYLRINNKTYGNNSYLKIPGNPVKSDILETKKQTTKPTRTRPYSTPLALTKPGM